MFLTVLLSACETCKMQINHFSIYSTICFHLLCTLKLFCTDYKFKAPFTPRTITIKITILSVSARLSAALNSRARYSRIDSDWLSMFLSFISWKKIVLIIFLICAFIVIAVVWTILLFFNIENVF